MVDRRTIELINGEVDGLNTPEESEALRQILERDPEARRLLEDLRKLGQSLSSVTPVPPPAALKRNIMNELRGRRAAAVAPVRKPSFFDYLFHARPLPRMGFAFSGGLLMGILLVSLYFALASHPPVDSRDVSGTILAPHEGFQTVDDTAFVLDGVQAMIATEFSGSASIMRVSLTLNQDIAARLVFDPQAARLAGVGLAEGFTGTLTQSEGAVEVERGGGTFKAFFVPQRSAVPEGSPAPDVRLQIVQGGTVVYERPCPLGKVQ